MDVVLKVYSRPVAPAVVSEVFADCGPESAEAASKPLIPEVKIPVRRPLILLASVQSHAPCELLGPLSAAVDQELPRGMSENGHRALLRFQKTLYSLAPLELQGLNLQPEDWLRMAAVAAVLGQLSQAAAWARQAVRLSTSQTKSNAGVATISKSRTELILADATAIYAIASLFSSARDTQPTSCISLLQSVYKQYMAAGAVLPAISILYHLALVEYDSRGPATAIATLQLATELQDRLSGSSPLNDDYKALISETTALVNQQMKKARSQAVILS